MSVSSYISMIVFRQKAAEEDVSVTGPILQKCIVLEWREADD